MALLAPLGRLVLAGRLESLDRPVPLALRELQERLGQPVLPALQDPLGRPAPMALGDPLGRPAPTVLQDSLGLLA
ncbi:hypothetical protein PAT3040_06176 [Paenibacillus agaridevorans]|uniref:Uncharacterized protein n=1 Tax=Paenibacillus agaridevorans TaxID=171404 RepID=A0A2R5F525_9BACL|nr:hypothetical protein PAT3040_06176 [Paenibacillus agaridevorans]